jgi:hypothetical protein
MAFQLKSSLEMLKKREARLTSAANDLTYLISRTHNAGDTAVSPSWRPGNQLILPCQDSCYQGAGEGCAWMQVFLLQTYLGQSNTAQLIAGCRKLYRKYTTSSRRGASRTITWEGNFWFDGKMARWPGSRSRMLTFGISFWQHARKPWLDVMHHLYEMAPHGSITASHRCKKRI